MPRPILNIDDVEFRDWGHNAGWPVGINAKEHYQARLGDIGRRLGAQKLGYNLTVVPPRKQAFPMHNHRANEEMFFIVSGEGELRVGKERFPLRPNRSRPVFLLRRSRKKFAEGRPRFDGSNRQRRRTGAAGD